MNLLLLELDRRSQRRRTLSSKLGGRVSDVFWFCLTSWSPPIDIELVELVSGLHVCSICIPPLAPGDLVTALRGRLALARL